MCCKEGHGTTGTGCTGEALDINRGHMLLFLKHSTLNKPLYTTFHQNTKFSPNNIQPIIQLNADAIYLEIQRLRAWFHKTIPCFHRFLNYRWRPHMGLSLTGLKLLNKTRTYCTNRRGIAWEVYRNQVTKGSSDVKEFIPAAGPCQSPL